MSHKLIFSNKLNRRQMLGLSVASLATFSAMRVTGASTPSHSRKVAVTIDDGPSSGAGDDLERFKQISMGLREAFVAEQVPAIMFVNERQLHVPGQRDERIELMSQWLDAGLDLGNHTYSHPQLENIGLRQYLDDIVKGEVVTRPLMRSRGENLVWFRYPYLATGRGEVAEAIETFLTQRDYQIAPVTVDYSDYRFAGPYARHLRAGDTEQAQEYFETLVLPVVDEGFDRAEKLSMEVLGYEPPLILLIHCNEMNSVTLRQTIQRIRDRGYSFVPIEEAMEDPAYRTNGLPPGVMGGGGLLHSLRGLRKEPR